MLEQYLEEGQLALSRYRLTRTVPALRDREIASMLGYQRLFREHLRAWLAEVGDPTSTCTPSCSPASVVTAHNVVLRRWLRGETADPGTSSTTRWTRPSRSARLDVADDVEPPTRAPPWWWCGATDPSRTSVAVGAARAAQRRACRRS